KGDARRHRASQGRSHQSGGHALEVGRLFAADPPAAAAARAAHHRGARGSARIQPRSDRRAPARLTSARPRDLAVRWSRSKEPPTRGRRETRGFRGVGNTALSVFDARAGRSAEACLGVPACGQWRAGDGPHRGPHQARFVGWMSAKDPDVLSRPHLWAFKTPFLTVRAGSSDISELPAPAGRKRSAPERRETMAENDGPDPGFEQFKRFLDAWSRREFIRRMGAGQLSPHSPPAGWNSWQLAVATQAPDRHR